MTKKTIKNIWGNKVIFTNLDPKETLDMLKEKGFETVIVTGGHLNTSFIKAGLIYLKALTLRRN